MWIANAGAVAPGACRGRARNAGVLRRLVITGDLTHQGERAAYEEFKRCLGETTLPVHLCIGNHDDREAFRRAFADEARYTSDDFVQYAVDDLDGHRLVLLDSNVPGSAGGLLCPARLSWLDETLAARPDAATLLFVHHPPFTTHIGPLDAIGLDGVDGFAEVIARHAQVRSIHAGHVHRTMYARLGTTPVTAAASTGYQIALDFEAPELVVTYEPPSFSVILADGGEVICHTHYFAEADGPRLADPEMRARYEPA